LSIANKRRNQGKEE
jgi:hypothetical protein